MFFAAAAVCLLLLFENILLWLLFSQTSPSKIFGNDFFIK